MRSYEFLLPFPPTVNKMYATVGKMRVLSKRGREYQAEVTAAMQEQKLTDIFLTGRLAVSIVMNPPCNRRRDIENFLKAPNDALTNCGLWKDDEQIDDLRIVRGIKSKPGFLSVIVRVIEEVGE